MTDRERRYSAAGRVTGGALGALIGIGGAWFGPAGLVLGVLLGLVVGWAVATTIADWPLAEGQVHHPLYVRPTRPASGERTRPSARPDHGAE